MATRNEVISYGPFPAHPGTVIDSIVVTFVGTNPANNQSQTVAPGTTSVTATLSDDTYTVTAQAFAAGTAVGPAASETFTILTTTTVQIPVALSGTTA
jgi:uncharacterized Zn-binding protein involved in type VI secretion